MGDVRDYEYVVDRNHATAGAWADQGTRFRARLAGTVMIVVASVVGVFAFRGVLLVGWLILGAALIARLIDDSAAFLRVRRAIAARDPIGSVLVARYTDEYLRLARGGTDLMVRYEDLGAMIVGRRFVQIWSLFDNALILPIALCPPVEQQRIRKGIRYAVRTDPDRAPFPLRVVVDEPYAWAEARRRVLRFVPVMVVSFAWLVWFAVAAAVTILPLPEWAWIVVLAAGALWLAWSLYRELGSMLGQLLGLEMFSRFEDDGFVIAERGMVMLYPYTAFDRVRVRGRVVELRDAGTRAWTFYPKELFPPSAISRFPAA